VTPTLRPAQPRVVLAALVALVALVAPVTAIAGPRIATVRSGSRAGDAARTRQTSRHGASASESRIRCRSPLASVSADAHPAVARPRRVRNSFGTRMFGIAAGGTLQTESRAQMRSDVADDARAGARWLRMDINWAQVQQRRHHRFFWRQINRVVARARLCGMHVLGTILYAPAWAQKSHGAGVRPPKPRLYARFAAAAARHLKHRGVSAFEIWNEPNVQAFWAPRPDARAYTRMLRLAYTAIKRVDPRATVVSGGLAPAVNGPGAIDPRRFLRLMYRHGAKNHFDALGHHPYGWTFLPGTRVRRNAWFQMRGSRPSLRSIMIAHGDGAKKIWGTEFGAPTWGPPGSSFVSLDEQARIIERAYRLWAGYPWAGPLFTYQGRDLGYQGNTNENFFGLLKFDGSPKPAFSAFQNETLAIAESENKQTYVAAAARTRASHRRRSGRRRPTSATRRRRCSPPKRCTASARHRRA
jgi:hypothetical protein